MKVLGLSKAELLRSKPEIDVLFAQGAREKCIPIIALYVCFTADSGSTNRLLFSAPKKLFKRAVDRNLIKRKMREAVRKNKNVFFEQLSCFGVGMNIAFVYAGKEILDSNQIENATIRLFNLIIKKLNKNRI